MSVVDIARVLDAVVAVKSETTGGTPEDDFSSGAKTITLVTRPSITQNITFEDSEEQLGTESWLERVKVNQEQVDIELTTYLKGGGSNTVDSEQALFWESLLGASPRKPTAHSTTTVSGSTTTVIKVTYSSVYGDWQAGDFIAIKDSNGKYEISRISSISQTAGTSDDITVSPAFSAAPSAGETVYVAAKYALDKKVAPQFTLRAADNVDGVIVAGSVVNSMAVTLGNNITRATYGMIGLSTAKAKKCTLAANVSASDTTFTINEEFSCEAGAIYEIGSEQVKVTAVDSTGKSLTVTRGINSTTAASHSSGDELTLPMPSLTSVGNEIAGTVSGMEIWDSGSRTFVELTGFSLNITKNITVLNSELRSSFDPRGLAIGTRREVTGSIETFLELEKGFLNQWAEQDIAKTIIVPLGLHMPIGNQIVFYLPNIQFSTASQGESDGLVTESADFKAYGINGEDEIELHVFSYA